MKKLIKITALVLGIVFLFTYPNHVSAKSKPKSTIAFVEDFENGLNGWSTEKTTIEQINGNHYAYLDGSEDWPPLSRYNEMGALQKVIPGVSVGDRYKITLEASGVGKVAINSSDYKISVNTGVVDMNKAKEYEYSEISSKTGVNITIIAYGTKLGVDNIKVEILPK